MNPDLEKIRYKLIQPGESLDSIQSRIKAIEHNINMFKLEKDKEEMRINLMLLREYEKELLG
jgi:hypothetical protein